MSRASTSARAVGMSAIIGAFAVVEFTSGILQGFYTPILSDIARHLQIHDADVNWFEGAQLMLAAMLVPLLSRLGDAIGHKRVLLIATAATAIASLVLPFTSSFPVFLVAWAVAGAYTVWLPLEIALIWLRAERAAAATPGARPAAITRRAAGILVAALEVGAIAGALGGGALIDLLPLWGVLLVPAVGVVVCFVVIALFVEESPHRVAGPFDAVGALLLTAGLLGLTGGISLLRLLGLAHPAPWIALVVAVALLAVFVRWESRPAVASPVVDVAMFRDPALWPVFLTAALFGVSVLGAQAPLSTFARTDPAAVGYGLGTTGFQTSLIIGAYVLTLAVGALLLPLATRLVTPRTALLGASLLVAIGYLLFLPFHDTYAQVLVNMIIAGVGSGALVAALPAAAAAAAPPNSTGVATGLTNGVKTIGGAVASAVFGLALASAVTSSASGSSGSAHAEAGSFEGYVTVWTVCGVTALIAAACLLVVPRDAFADRRDATVSGTAEAAGTATG